MTYSNITISLSVTNEISGMVSRAKAKRGEQTHTPQLCNGGTIMYIALVNPSLWRMFLMLPMNVASRYEKSRAGTNTVCVSLVHNSKQQAISN